MATSSAPKSGRSKVVSRGFVRAPPFSRGGREMLTLAAAHARAIWGLRHGPHQFRMTWYLQLARPRLSLSISIGQVCATREEAGPGKGTRPNFCARDLCTQLAATFHGDALSSGSTGEAGQSILVRVLVGGDADRNRRRGGASNGPSRVGARQCRERLHGVQRKLLAHAASSSLPLVWSGTVHQVLL